MGEVRIKPLEWDTAVMPPFERFARTLIGTYRVTRGQVSGSGWWVYFNGMMGAEGHASEDEAMTEAQADYEARIRSALLPDVSGMAEPRLWFVKDFADGWIAFQDKELAEAEAQATGAMMLLGYQSPPATPPASEREEVERLRKALQEIAQPTVDNSVTYARELAFKALNPEGK